MKDASRGEGQGLPGELAAATSDIAGEILEAPVHSHLPGASGTPDNLQTLKGVGPKFAQMLNARGIIRYDQLAKMSGQEVELLDAQLGPFRGRLQRDRVIEQADYLARGDKEASKRDSEASARPILLDCRRFRLTRAPLRPRRDELVDLAAVHVDHLELPAVVSEGLSGFWQVLQH